MCFGSQTTTVTPPPPPTPPTAGEASREALETQMELAPEYYALEQEYRPRYAELDYQIASTYGPQLAQLARSVQQSLYPTESMLEENLAQTALGNLGAVSSAEEREAIAEGIYSNLAAETAGLGEIGEPLLEKYKQDIRSGQATRGLGLSPLSAAEEATELAELGEARRQYDIGTQMGLGQLYSNLGASSEGRRQFDIGTALSIAGRQPVARMTPTQQGGIYSPPTTSNLLNYTTGRNQNVMQGYQASLPTVLAGPSGFSQASEGMAGMGSLAMGLAMLSSITLKKNIEPINNALDKVLKLQGVHFDWIDTNKEDSGLIAEEVEKIIPEAVTEIDNIKAIKPYTLLAYAFEAIKELAEKVERRG